MSLTKVFLETQTLNETSQTPQLSELGTRGSRSGLSDVAKALEDRTPTPAQLTAADVLCMRFLLFTRPPGPGERWSVPHRHVQRHSSGRTHLEQ